MTPVRDSSNDSRTAMRCPRCNLDPVLPLEGSTLLVTWYRCQMCGHFWSAHVRDGRPVAEHEAT